MNAAVGEPNDLARDNNVASGIYEF
jgi:hypothetical protein